MAVSTFTYCDQAFLSTQFPKFIDLLPIKQLRDWRSIATNVYAGERVGFDGVLYSNKKDLGSYKLTAIAASPDTTITSAITTLDGTTVSLDSVTNIEKGTVIQIGSEKMFVVSIATKDATVIRGFFGTTRATALNGATVSLIGLAFDSENEWYYDTATDMVVLYTATNPNQLILEMSVDKDTAIDQALVDASMLLNSNFDARHNIPIPKAYQYGADPDNDTPEYDFVIKKLTAMLLIITLMEADGQNPEVLQEKFDKILDDINTGKIQLRYEKDDTDPQGDLITVVKAGTMELVETYGQYAGSALYDRIQVLCTTGGAYGTATVSVKQSNGTALYGSVETGVIITGDLDYIGNGLYARFQGASMTASDRWDIIVKNPALENTVDQVESTDLVR